MKYNKDLLSKNLKLLRITHGFSQAELAEKLYLTRSTYTDYEKCTRTPDLRTLDALAGIYNISLDTLVFQDLSQVPFNSIYLDENHRMLGLLLSEFENLTVSSRSLIMERMNTLLEREEIFYSHYMPYT